jgi:hypothetical protein
MNYKYQAIEGINLIDNNTDLKEVWVRLKIKWDENLKEEIDSFFIGETLEVKMKDGMLYNAKVLKRNQKTIKVLLTDEEYNDTHTYNVHPMYLHRDS